MKSRTGAQQKKAAFLEHFRASGNVSAACRASGLARRTLYDWLEALEPNDQVRAFQHAYAEAEQEATEHLEEEALRRAHGYEVVRTKVEVLRRRDGSAVLDLQTGEPKYVETERVITHEYSP